ncbi:enoyl-CoA hydratase/isomerase family protein [Romeria aff. gracilis LEGE 07310]|uniref:Enoyl-CoA hydratase/isomerase family protein n=1 Tax=Vasconcelosia minhoensis LEGE 07310 TaxID=915328 RepID=A0A8J7AY27_9CYAN|nr:3-hydroxyacyl-CoA dehydrogenase/enoyl-CoA hydratase family protein [Romeria gracilis]MBE9078252.1 enoyl-CoA hydratase/isomerase family protein [Romeria aff. gracilis LEGE 07310]
MFKPFRTAAVLGAGVMGSQIAAHLANAGLRVHLLDLPAGVDRAGQGDRNALVAKAFAKARKLSPPIFFSDREIHRIQLGNFEDHFYRLGEVDWVIEAVTENLEIKRQLMARLEGVVKADAVISSNTSGLPIQQIAAGCTEHFRQRFLGTHFFNPPRYLKLLELIPTADTESTGLERMAWFGREYLGKGVVVAKDTPNFIANRIGLFVTFSGMQALTQGYSIEEIDTITGTLVGRPKSATFRTADLVGLDTLQAVAKHLHQAVPEDEQRDRLAVPPLLSKLVETGAVGAKVGRGFYQKVKGEILSVNPESLAYEPAKPLRLEGLTEITQQPLADRLRSLYQLPGRAGDLFRQITWAMLSYSACRLPEIADRPLDIDQAMRWGFGWQLGPFEIWDVLGVQRVLNDLQAQQLPVPAWVEKVAAQAGSFYQEGSSDGLLTAQTVVGPAGSHAVQKPAKELSVAALQTSPSRILWQNAESAWLDMGEGVTLFEFRSKGNTLSNEVMQGLEEILNRLETDASHGLVIGNDGDHFCGGANLVEMGQMAQTADWDAIAHLISHFQSLLQRIHHFHKPVVAAVRGRALGGGCELVMACPQVVAAAESYIGLVELGVGLIPGAGGIMRMVERSADRAASNAPSHIQPFINQTFQTIALGKVSTSAEEAQQLGYLLPTARMVMNGDQRLYVAKEEVLRLARQGYRPWPERHDIWVLGQPGRATLEHMAYVLQQGGFASEYDRFLASRLAYVMTGGELTAPARVSADYLLQLERENFVPLLENPKTQARMAHLLKYKKPLRN